MFKKKWTRQSCLKDSIETLAILYLQQSLNCESDSLPVRVTNESENLSHFQGHYFIDNPDFHGPKIPCFHNQQEVKTQHWMMWSMILQAFWKHST